MSQSAPIGAYTQLCPKTKTTTEEQRTLLALPLIEYTDLDTFKNKFFIDEVVIFTNVGKATPDATTFTKGGIMAFVKPGGPNAQHHNLSTTFSSDKPSRLSKLRIKKKVGNVETEYQALNDGGLNTTPDVIFNISVAYENYLIVNNIKIISAYWLNTQDDYQASLKINNGDPINVLSLIEGLNGTLPRREVNTLFSSANNYCLLELSNAPKGTPVFLSIGAKNDEGTYSLTQSKNTKDAIQELSMEREVRIFGDSLPKDSSEVSNAPLQKIYQYQKDVDQTNTTDISIDAGGDGTPDYGNKAQVPAYTSIYMDNTVSGIYDHIKYFPKGWFQLDLRSLSGAITFYHVKGSGIIDCWHQKNIVLITPTIKISIEEKMIVDFPTYADFPIEKNVTITRYNDNNPQAITVKFGVYSSNSSGTHNIGLQFRSPSNGAAVSELMNLTLSMKSAKNSAVYTIYLRNPTAIKHYMRLDDGMITFPQSGYTFQYDESKRTIPISPTGPIL